MKKILFIITLLLISVSNVNAEACDAYDIKRLKEIAEGVEITYELLPVMETEDEIIRDRYKINITGLTDEIIAYNETDEIYYSEDKNLERDYGWTSGKKKILIDSRYCARTLKVVNIKLPVYNFYFNSDYCKDEKNKNIYICQEWLEERIDREEFLITVEEKEKANNEEKTNYIWKYRYFMYCGIMMLLLLILYLIFKRKKERLE